MSSTAPPAPPTPRTGLARPARSTITVTAVFGVLLIAAIASVISLRLNVATLVDSVGNAVDFGSRMLPLDFPPLGELVAMTGTTLALVTCATVLAVLLSVPTALFAASNTTSGSGARSTARGLIVLTRAVPDLVLAIVFFRVFGLGGLTGVLAMGLHSVGMIGKLYADAVEQIDEGPRTALRASGAGPLQQIAGAVLPQVMPAFVATALHRFDINLRVSVVLGFVGVGGIGFEIAGALGRLDYRRGMALALVVFVLCVLVELLSGAVRRALLGQGGGWARGSSAGDRDPAPVGQAPVSPPWDAARIGRAVGLVVGAVIVVASLRGAEISVEQFVTGIVDLPAVLGLFLPPSTGGALPELLADLLVTVQIALAGTLLGAVLALPAGALAARNVSGPRVSAAFRTAIVAVRGVPELILAIVFVVVTGLGAVAGAAALALGSVGLLGKLVADSLEETDLGVQEAVRATGATGPQVFFAATLPQAAPAVLAHLLYQLDVNVRAATLLGIVGAGGIGFYLQNAARVNQFDVVTTVILLVLAVVLAVEALALWGRRALRAD